MAASRRSTRTVAIALSPCAGRPPNFGLAGRDGPAQLVMPVHRRQRMIPAPDLLDDSVRISRPDEWPGIPVMLLEEAVDRFLERDQRMERAASQASPGQLGEE